MRKHFLLATAALALISFSPAQAATEIGNSQSGNISPFGRPDTLTYGQVFMAPVSGIMTSFSFWLNGRVQGVSGGVGTWNDPDLTFGLGHGSPTNLFLGAPSNVNGKTTILPGVSVVAGQIYVAYLTAFGNPGPNGTVPMQLGTPSPDLGYFVWNNTSNPVNNPSWNYFSNFGNARFTATFEPSSPAVPEPSTWALLLMGLFAAGAAMRRRRQRAPGEARISYTF